MISIKFCGFCCLLFLSGSLHAQQHSSILNAGGAYCSQKDLHVEWNIGESSLVNTFSNGSFVLTQGLLQGYMAFKPTVLETQNWRLEELKIYPNPTQTFFQLDLFSTIKGWVEWVIIDNHGAPLQKGGFEYFGEGKSIKIDLTTYPAGTYLLKVIMVKYGLGKKQLLREGGFKIIKINMG